MNRIARTSFWTIIFGLILLISVGSVSAQKKSLGPVAALWEDTALNPHDFTNAYYWTNGIVGRSIIGRRTGSDGLSIFGNSSNPTHRNIRVIATIPAYDQNGSVLFWYPLGELDSLGFTPDKNGIEAREMAMLFPIYVFPDSKVQNFRTFADTRQAALMDNTWSMVVGQDINPLGFRELIFVNFTERAFTEEGSEMMNYMAKKNGTGVDDTPIINSLDDLRMMMKYGLVETGTLKGFPTYAIAPTINDPTNGVIAPDAYLWFATKDGTPLPTENMFAWQFGCLQKTGNWCKE